MQSASLPILGRRRAAHGAQTGAHLLQILGASLQAVQHCIDLAHFGRFVILGLGRRLFLRRWLGSCVISLGRLGRLLLGRTRIWLLLLLVLLLVFVLLFLVVRFLLVVLLVLLVFVFVIVLLLLLLLVLLLLLLQSQFPGREAQRSLVGRDGVCVALGLEVAVAQVVEGRRFQRWGLGLSGPHQLGDGLVVAG